MPKPIRCFIIDDEPPARIVLEKFINRIPYLELVGFSDNAVDALFQLPQIQPNLIFLDIEMPEMTAFEFLRTLPLPHPAIILVTAYPQYALEGFEHGVADYLLKPVAFERFMRAINKVNNSLEKNGQPESVAGIATESATVAGGNGEKVEETPPAQTAEPKADFLLVKEDKKLVRVELNEVVFVESMKDYLKIHLNDRTLITHMTMNRLEEMLPPASFVRVNRSFIVRKGAIREIDGNQIITTDKRKVPIGVTYRDSVLEAVKRT